MMSFIALLVLIGVTLVGLGQIEFLFVLLWVFGITAFVIGIVEFILNFLITRF